MFDRLGSVGLGRAGRVVHDESVYSERRSAAPGGTVWQVEPSTGYGLTMLRRVLRRQAAVRLAAQGWTLAEVGARSGYADQAHLSREVVALTGRTPAVVLPRPAQPSGAKRSTGLPSGSSTVA